ncbi:MAG: SIS domain-containing protein [Bacillota bacterium]
MRYKNSVTYKEIVHQPELWFDTWQIFQNNGHRSLFRMLRHEYSRIIVTGAGSSYFAALTAVPLIRGRCSLDIVAVPTTDIVSNPAEWLLPNVPTAIISIARSGNSPESLAVIDLAAALLDKVFHVGIICNPDGLLTDKISSLGGKNIFLPAAANEEGFASTGSYTATVFALLLLFGIEQTLSDSLVSWLEKSEAMATVLMTTEFQRIVFLGSGSLFGAARESALKVTELSGGKIAAFYDSPLGFRHGPKAIIDNATVVCSFISTDGYTAKYDDDMLNEIVQADRAVKIIEFDAEKQIANDGLLAMQIVTFAQFLGLMLAEKFKLDPDNPSADGTINKVVQGVNIYPYKPQDTF